MLWDTILNIKYHEYAFDFTIFFIWTLYFIALFGFFKQAPKYLDKLHFYFTLYISIVLVLRFNPFIKTTFTTFDKKLVFNSGMLLFTSIVMNAFLFK
jgi:hypothetical protein